MWEGLNYTEARLLGSKRWFGPYLPQAPNSISKYGMLIQNWSGASSRLVQGQFGAYIGILCDNALNQL